MLLNMRLIWTCYKICSSVFFKTFTPCKPFLDAHSFPFSLSLPFPLFACPPAPYLPFFPSPLSSLFVCHPPPYPPLFPSSPYILPWPTDLPNALALKGSLALSQCNLRGRCMYIYVYGWSRKKEKTLKIKTDQSSDRVGCGHLQKLGTCSFSPIKYTTNIIYW